MVLTRPWGWGGAGGRGVGEDDIVDTRRKSDGARVAEPGTSIRHRARRVEATLDARTAGASTTTAPGTVAPVTPPHSVRWCATVPPCRSLVVRPASARMLACRPAAAVETPRAVAGSVVLKWLKSAAARVRPSRFVSAGGGLTWSSRATAGRPVPDR
ncbi:hypothetical protein CQW39_20730 [Streptomyces griseofuscus]|nr:hypothetical protein CQW39_20730 [Streptomyces griseofuscus]